MKRKIKTKSVKNAVRKKKFTKFLFFLSVFVLIALCFGAYLGMRLLIDTLTKEAGLDANTASSPMPSSQSAFAFPSTSDLSDSFSVRFDSPVLIGTERAVISAELTSEKSTSGAYGFLIRNITNNTGYELPAESNGTLLYAKTDQMTADTDYQIAAYTLEDDKKIYARTMLDLSTPKQILSKAQVEDILANEFPEGSEALAEVKQLAFETEACLSVMGFDVGGFGDYDIETKSAILMLEYSFNSAEHICDWDMMTGMFTESLLETLKDILSVTPITDKDSVLKPFTVSCYPLTAYAEYTDRGAAIDCDQLVLDSLKQNEAATATFNEYPFVVDSPEFQDQYAGLINGEISESEMSELAARYGRDTLNQPLETTLAAIAAKNKVYFANTQRDWLLEISGNFGSAFTISGTENEQTAFTLLFPAAVAFCYMNEDYKTRSGGAMPVSLNFRNTPKNWTAYSSGYGRNEVLKYSALWHLAQQEKQCVPGFCLTEFLVSVDFAPADDTILTSDAYNYLYAHAAQYGFYPDINHPFRWIYLGTTLSEDTLAQAPPTEPLEK